MEFSVKWILRSERTDMGWPVILLEAGKSPGVPTFRFSTRANFSRFAARAVLASVAMGVLTALCYTSQLNLATTSLLLLLVAVIQAMGGGVASSMQLSLSRRGHIGPFLHCSRSHLAHCRCFRGCFDDVRNRSAYHYPPPGIRRARGGLQGGNMAQDPGPDV